MSNYVWDDTSLPNTKTNNAAGSAGRLTATEFNTVRQALLDVKAIQRAYSGKGPSILAYGAKGDGTTDDTAAFSAAITAGVKHLVVPPGTYKVSSALTFASTFVSMPAGAMFTSSVAVAIAFNAGVDWSLDQHIAGSVTASFASKKTTIGFPEWFGAVVNAGDSTSGATNNTALAACLTACKWTVLQRADYWINSTLVIPEGSTFIGAVGTRGTGGSAGMTRLLIRSQTATTALVGVSADPGSINSYAKNIAVENIEFTRDTTLGAFRLLPPAAGSEFSGAAGIEFKHCLYVQCKNVWSRENQIGYLFNGAVNLRLDDCFAERSAVCDAAATNPDYWYGAAFNGSSDLAALSTGGNVSIMLFRCNFSLGGTVAAVSGGAPITSTAVNVNGPSSDLWLDTVESIQTQKGLEIAGASTTSAQRLNSFIDISIQNCKFDQVSSRGVYLHDLPTGACVSISNTYTALGGGSPLSCFEVRDSGGMVTIDANCQAVCNSAVNAIGLYLHNASGVRAEPMIENSQRPVVAETGCADCEVRCIVNTTEDATIAPVQGVVESTSSVRVLFAPRVKSSVTTGAKRHPYGVNLASTGNTFCTVDTTGIDPAAISGGASAVVRYNSADARDLGAAGSNLVIGIRATLPASTIVGNNSGSSAIPAALTVAQVQALLQAFSLGKATAFQTSGAGTFTTPSDSTTSTKYRAKLLGAGGGSGGSGTSASAATGGGGAGEYCEVVFWGIAPSTGITLSIGAKGTGGSTSATDGTAGGATTIALPNGAITNAGTFAGGTTIGANGGSQSTGKTAVAASPGGAGGTGGAGTADWRAAGKTGECGYPATKGGRGADSIWGGGGNATGNNQGNTNATGWGAGGGGAAGLTNAGTTGSDGMIVIERLTP